MTDQTPLSTSVSSKARATASRTSSTSINANRKRAIIAGAVRYDDIPRIKIPSIFGRVWQSKRPYQIWYGSRFSSKSWSKAIQFLLKAQSQPYFRGVFARDTQKNVRLAQYQLFQDICKRFDCFRDQFQFRSDTMTVTCTKTGNFMVGGSFEQPDTLRSVADPTDFWAEEPITRSSQINRQDFLDIAGSLRNTEGYQPQFHFTFNPISKESWIYKDFFEKQIYGDSVEVLHVNYTDNPYCPPDRVEFLDMLKTIDPERYRVDGLGEWGVAREGLIYKRFNVVDAMPGPPAFYGVDFGHTNPCAIVAGTIRDQLGKDRNDLYWDEMLYKTGMDESALIAEVRRLQLRRDVPMICDNESPSAIAALKRAGYRAVPCKKFAGSVFDGINFVLSHDIHITRRSENLLTEVANYQWAIDKTGEYRDAPESNSVCHALDAGRYGV